MRALAKDEITRHTRSELRRRKREAKALRKRPDRNPSTASELEASFAEFLVTLTPAERSFASNYLLAQSPPVGESETLDDSMSRIWQLTSRVRKKLLSFLQR